MPSDGSVTRWIALVQAGDGGEDAARRLFERYFADLVGLARKKLQHARRAAADEEDVALNVLEDFLRNAKDGHFPLLIDRDGLWRLLVVITVRKAAHLVRDENRQKRGGAIASVAAGSSDSDARQLLELLESREATPELAAQAAEECRRLLSLLDNKELEQVALWRMEGFSVDEIAAELGCAPRSVKRKLQLIRSTWEKAEAL